MKIFRRNKKLVRGVEKTDTRDVEYSIGQRKLMLPHDHPLPRYQKDHRLYDQFLPILVSHLDPKGKIIDIGANVGDTTLGMVQNCSNHILAIEPSQIYFPFLKKNIENLSTEEKNRVKYKMALIGTGSFTGNLKHINGSASLNLKDGSNTSFLSLDELAKENNSLSLIKIDTDGYDFDVLLSGLNTLETFKPILYWENQMLEEFQKIGFKSLYISIQKLGYNYIFIFDNFGNIILENTSLENLGKLNKYVAAMDAKKSTRTIYYTDVLAVTKKDVLRVEQAIIRYKEIFDLQ